MWSNFEPQSVIFNLGQLQFHWYGLILTMAGLAAYGLVRFLARQRDLKTTKLADLIFYLVVFGLLGARLYHVLLEADYYFSRPGEILAIWQGGLAIHGGILAGAAVLWWFKKKKKIAFWAFSDLLVVGLSLGQAIGRWGNFFNQELFGRPTALPWKIYISPAARPPGFESFSHFHPVFLYESLANLVLFVILFFGFRARKFPDGTLTFFYLIGYSLIRFWLEFIRLDPSPVLGGLRFPQLVSLVLLLIAVVGLFWQGNRKKNNN